jgi:hypothetical protein
MEDYAARGGFGAWRILDLARRLRSAPSKLEDLCRLVETATNEIRAMRAAAPSDDAEILGNLESRLIEMAVELGCDGLAA